MGAPRGRRVALDVAAPGLTLWAVGAVMLLAMAASAAPSPLYRIYQDRWQFSSFLLTAAYASYALAALASLLLVGRISDDVGRRPTLLAGLAVLATSFGLFLAARSIVWLIVARTVQGLSIGLLMGTAGAALVDLRHGRGPRLSAGLVNGSLTSFGLAVGALGAATLAVWSGDPLTVPFVVLLSVCAVLALWSALLPDPAPGARPGRLRPQVPRVPTSIRAPFVLSALGVLAAWSVIGLLLALGPTLADHLLGRSDPIAGGAFVAVVAATGGVAQIATRTLRPQRAITTGTVILAVGLALTCIAVSVGSPVLFYVMAAATGAGFGIAFFGSLRAVEAIAPAEARAQVLAAFYVVAYVASSVPALAAGAVVARLHVLETFQVFAAVIILLTLAIAVIALRLRAPLPQVSEPRIRR